MICNSQSAMNKAFITFICILNLVLRYDTFGKQLKRIDHDQRLTYNSFRYYQVREGFACHDDSFPTLFLFFDFFLIFFIFFLPWSVSAEFFPIAHWFFYRSMAGPTPTTWQLRSPTPRHSATFQFSQSFRALRLQTVHSLTLRFITRAATRSGVLLGRKWGHLVYRWATVTMVTLGTAYSRNGKLHPAS